MGRPQAGESIIQNVLIRKPQKSNQGEDLASGG